MKLKLWTVQASKDVPGVYLLGEYQQFLFEHNKGENPVIEKILEFDCQKNSAQILANEHNKIVIEIAQALDKAKDSLTSYLWDDRK